MTSLPLLSRKKHHSLYNGFREHNKQDLNSKFRRVGLTNPIFALKLRRYYRLAVTKVTPMIDQIQWLGHGSFAILGDPLIYINPWRVTRIPRPADAILIGNEHYDNCSLADIEKLRGPNTQVIASSRAAP